MRPNAQLKSAVRYQRTRNREAARRARTRADAVARMRLQRPPSGTKVSMGQPGAYYATARRLTGQDEAALAVAASSTPAQHGNEGAQQQRRQTQRSDVTGRTARGLCSIQNE